MKRIIAIIATLMMLSITAGMLAEAETPSLDFEHTYHTGSASTISIGSDDDKYFSFFQPRYSIDTITYNTTIDIENFEFDFNGANINGYNVEFNFTFGWGVYSMTNDGIKLNGVIVSAFAWEFTTGVDILKYFEGSFIYLDYDGTEYHNYTVQVENPQIISLTLENIHTVAKYNVFIYDYNSVPETLPDPYLVFESEEVFVSPNSTTTIPVTFINPNTETYTLEFTAIHTSGDNTYSITSAGVDQSPTVDITLSQTTFTPGNTTFSILYEDSGSSVGDQTIITMSILDTDGNLVRRYIFDSADGRFTADDTDDSTPIFSGTIITNVIYLLIAVFVLVVLLIALVILNKGRN